MFVDPMLPFGLRSAPKIFNAVADALHWVLQQAGVRYLFHYLDDYIARFPRVPGGNGYHCGSLPGAWVPLATHKTDGLTCIIVFLGIVIDTVAGVLCLPEDKLQRLQELLRTWGDHHSCTRNDLESLVGHLNHAAKVVRSRRAFFRRMLDLLHNTSGHRGPRDPIRLNTGFRSDLAWWGEFAAPWNGISTPRSPGQGRDGLRCFGIMATPGFSSGGMRDPRTCLLPPRN